MNSIAKLRPVTTIDGDVVSDSEGGGNVVMFHWLVLRGSTVRHLFELRGGGGSEGLESESCGAQRYLRKKRVRSATSSDVSAAFPLFLRSRFGIYPGLAPGAHVALRHFPQTRAIYRLQS